MHQHASASSGAAAEVSGGEEEDESKSVAPPPQPPLQQSLREPTAVEIEREGYGYDYCLVMKHRSEAQLVQKWPDARKRQRLSLRGVAVRLARGGLQAFVFRTAGSSGGMEQGSVLTANDDSEGGGDVFIKLRVPLLRLQQEADRIGFVLKLDHDNLREAAALGYPPRMRSGTGIADLPIPAPGALGASALAGKTADERRQRRRQARQDRKQQLAQRQVVGPISIKDEMGVSALSPYDYIFGRYLLDARVQHLYVRCGPRHDTGGGGLFRSVDRLKLLASILGAPPSSGGCGLDLSQLIAQRALRAAFPLHQLVPRQRLRQRWIVQFALPNEQPFDQIKDYFGEKVAMYFAWLGHYTSWLITASVAGFVASIAMWTNSNNPDTALMPYFAMIMALWSTLFEEAWKRRAAVLAMCWGTTGHHSNEQDRPQFEGEIIASPVDGRPIKYAPPRQRWRRYARSAAVMLGVTCTLLGSTAAVFAFQAWASTGGREKNFTTSSGAPLGPWFGMGLQSLLVLLGGSVLSPAARALTDAENYKTESQWEAALTLKVFVLAFFNAYSALFYIIFLKTSVQGAASCQLDRSDKPNCLVELSNTLAVIFVSQLLAGNFIELLWPLIRLRLLRCKRSCCARRAGPKNGERLTHDPVATDVANLGRGVAMSGSTPLAAIVVHQRAEQRAGGARAHRRSVTSAGVALVRPRGEADAELQYMMEEYGAVSLVDDYTEMVLQFGYVTLFVAVFPLAPLLALVNNYLEIRIDAYRLCAVHRRPMPQSAEGVALWGDILHAMAFFSVAVSGSIVCFQSTNFTSKMGDAGRVWAFVLFEHLIMGIKAVVDLVIDDVPTHIQMQKERQDFLVRKVINLEPDDDETGLGKQKKDSKDAKLLLILDSWQPGKKKKNASLLV